MCGEGENLALSVLHGFRAHQQAEFTSLRQMTLFEHDVACRSASAKSICDSSRVTHCHASVSACMSMVMHRDLPGPDSMHYEYFNCTYSNRRLYDSCCSPMDERPERLSAGTNRVAIAVCCHGPVARHGTLRQLPTSKSRVRF